MNRLTFGGMLILVAVVGLAIVIVASVFVQMRCAKDERAWITATVLSACIGLWLAVVYALSVSGWTSEWNALPPRVPVLLVLPIVSYLGILLTRVARLALAVTPLWLPILIQSFRLLVESALWQLHREGSVPIQFTFEGRNLDMLTGLTAPLVALGVATKWLGPKAIAAWNFFGMTLLINAIATAATSSPGPQHLDWHGEPFTAIATWPLVWLPSFLAPTAVFLHAVSIKQVIQSRRESET